MAKIFQGEYKYTRNLKRSEEVTELILRGFVWSYISNTEAYQHEAERRIALFIER